MVHLNATINGPDTKPITLIASAGVKRIDTSTNFGGYQNFDTDNRFKYYQQLSTSFQIVEQAGTFPGKGNAVRWYRF